MSEDKDFYIGEDGLEYCSNCHTPRQHAIPNSIMGADFKVHIICKCQRNRYEAEQAERKERELQALVAGNRSICFHESRMREWTFENDDGKNPMMDKAKAFVANWDEIKHKRAGLILFGGVGSGKTYMAAAIANALLDKGLRVLMKDFAEISNISIFDSEEYVKSLSDYDLLILDDLGAERKSEFAMQNVFNVVNRRWESGKPLIVTTNLSLIEMKQLRARDDIQYQRIYDRIFDMCVPLCVDGASKRLPSAENKCEYMESIFEKGGAL